jgi:nucleoside-triphosphatase THEP1
VLTGERGAGKSVLCKRVADEAGRRGLSVAGLVTERLDDAPGSPRRVIDLASGESRLFGSQRAAAAGTDPLTPGWDYDQGMFDWANQVLSRSTPCDLLIVDEVGPLELKGSRGWVKALEALCAGDFRVALVVCRPALLPELTERLGSEPTQFTEVDLDTRESLAATLLQALFPARSR